MKKALAVSLLALPLSLGAARNDVANGRPPSFDHHPRYRNPPVPPPAWGDYRSGFRQGYEQFLHQGPPPPPPGA